MKKNSFANKNKTLYSPSMDKIICLGKNYADHIKEMQEAAPERPVLFIKPASTLKELKDKANVQLPWQRGLIHHECEVVLKLYKKMVIGVGLGLDLTLRDEQKKLKEKGHPWEISKTFKNSALVTPFRSTKDFQDWKSDTFTLKVNGEIRQQSSLDQAIMKADEIIHYIDAYFPLCDGDIVFTGTPQGVGPLNPHDLVELNYGPIHLSFRLVE
jgi:2-keto-4-pentenoate hydratase/2-oxohepta-3-ene-1,7-dioic acid hydratase in catechol pathway